MALRLLHAARKATFKALQKSFIPDDHYRMPRFSLAFQRMGVVFALAFLSQLLNAHHGDMYHDAWGYLNLATKMVGSKASRGFNILYFDSPLRGYLFSLLLLPLLVLQYLTHVPLTLLTKAFGCMWAAILIGGFWPILWQRLDKRTRAISWPTFLLFVAAFLCFWRDYLTFTLTDIPALTLLLAGLFSLEKKKFRWWLLAGLCVAAATNLRPVYSITLPIVAGLIAWLIWRRTGLIKWFCLIGFAIGLLIVWTPQGFINYRLFNKKSLFVLGIREANVLNAPELDNLYLWHLNAGLKSQKFGPTMVGVTPNTVQFVPDPVGNALMVKRHGQPLRSVSEYLAFGLHNIPEFTAIYVRHLFNALDIDYPSTYILQTSPPSAWYCWLNYSLIFLGGIGLMRLNWSNNALIFAILLALGGVIAVSIPIVIEPRLAMSLHLLLLAAATMGIKPLVWRRWYRGHRRMMAGIFVIYTAWILLAFVLHTSREALLSWLLPEIANQRFI